ncbi:hypothetical protein [Streptomyces sp. NPDC001296]
MRTIRRSASCPGAAAKACGIRGGALSVDPPFARPETAAPLRAAFDELRLVVTSLATADDDPGVLTVTVWSGLHGPLTLMRGGRLRRDRHDRRLALLIDRIGPPRSEEAYSSRCAS